MPPQTWYFITFEIIDTNRPESLSKRLCVGPQRVVRSTSKACVQNFYYGKV